MVWTSWVFRHGLFLVSTDSGEDQPKPLDWIFVFILPSYLSRLVLLKLVGSCLDGFTVVYCKGFFKAGFNCPLPFNETRPATCNSKFVLPVNPFDL